MKNKTENSWTFDLTFYDFNERKPPESGEYLFAESFEARPERPFHVVLTTYSARWDLWNSSDDYDQERAEKYALDLTGKRVFWADFSGVEFTGVEE